MIIIMIMITKTRRREKTAKRTWSGLKLVEATVSSIILSRQFCYESQRTELSTNHVSVVTL